VIIDSSVSAALKRAPPADRPPSMSGMVEKRGKGLQFISS